MSVGIRGPSPTIDDVMRTATASRITLLVCPEIEKTDNLGAIIRIAAAFGIDAMILGQHCCDPFFRQSVRVSMGAAFFLPIVRTDDLQRDLKRLRAEFNVHLVGSVLSESAQPLERFHRPERLALLLGNEAQGLGPQLESLCDHLVTIPMRLGTDSLNVSIAAAVFLYELTREKP
jgi:tRNA G18 (ribose-2'-O)-methylase SpoU